MIDHWLSLIEQYLSHKTAVAALVAGFVTSWGMTQGWKFQPLFNHGSDRLARWQSRALAFVTGFGPVASLWPSNDGSRWAMAIAVGVISPMAYKVVTGIVYHFAPWLEQYLSARPRDAS